MSNYTGSPTATQAPSPPPTPGALPVGDLPDDGDPANAASVAQAFKTPLDYIAWLMNPRAQTAAWAEAVMRFKDARLRDRFIVDHFGLPGGELFEWREAFGKRTPWLLTGGASGTALGTSGRTWALNQSGTSTIGVSTAGISAGINFSNNHATLQMVIDASAAHISEMLMADDCNDAIWSDDTLCELDYNLQQHVVTDVTWVHGVCGQGEHVNTIANGAFFIRPDSPGATWKARTIAGGVQTEVDTGVAGTADLTHHYKIAIVGSSIDDSSAARALFFVDGALKANITTNIPAAGTRIYPVWGGFSGSGGGTKTLLLGPPHWAQITRSATP